MTSFIVIRKIIQVTDEKQGKERDIIRRDLIDYVGEFRGWITAGREGNPGRATLCWLLDSPVSSLEF
jgi:hypothetical protein